MPTNPIKIIVKYIRLNYLIGEAMKLIDRVGIKYGMLTVVKRAENKSLKDTNARWHCVCDCGNETISYGIDLAKGKSTNCGCVRNANTGKRVKEMMTTHGMSKTRYYRNWASMMNRCYRKENWNYPNYGGRGITVSEEWHKFENFVNDMGLPEKGMTLDRIDNNKGYSKENCRWATRKTQAGNRRNGRKFTLNGMTLTLAEWSEIIGISYYTLYDRYSRGLPVEKILSPKLAY
jgi:hypothetical protein